MSSSLILHSMLPKALVQRSVLRSAARARHASNHLTYLYTHPRDYPYHSKTKASYHWVFERLLSAALVPMTVAGFATNGTNYPILDGILGLCLVIHSHFGLDSVVVDYLHARKWPILGPVTKWTLRTATVATMIGVYQFNTNDIGLAELIARVWTA
ncbi:hypothetical protein GYMLUDRAFT_42916 [Collybiopsis luxurians FD-317 M1]|uniref:Succinate dehydrogenase [ubiquinone] cytochrome b small subunit n=1 Tax=Collybiopsis luxurians FD-317 M1 TaxID=944289 RepID=A0A0D0CQK8_9AGAR|nr:hypothetical protein GYMLUDRAFT_42916 [Collybiopsis luxurians FD-317 M1]